jgi:hypothetical protein
MAQALKVGGDVDAMCTKCKLVLGHTILAMVGSKPARVRCNTCDGEHKYRGTAGAEPKKGTWKSRSEIARRLEKPTVTTWEALMREKDLSRARRYSARERFAVNELIEHPSFGVGLVQSIRGDKMDVAFKVDVKVLVHGKA